MPLIAIPSRLRHLLVVVFGLALLGPLGGVATAATEGGPPAGSSTSWGISPATATGRDLRAEIVHVVDPGGTITEHVVVDNFSDAPVTLDLYASDARPAGGAFDVAAADEPSESVGAWVELAQGKVDVPARGHSIVELIIRVPADAAPGDHAGGILASRRTEGSGEDVGIETERRVGARVHLRVAGSVAPELSVADLRATYGHRLNPVGRGDVSVAFTVENTGNIRLSGETGVAVHGPAGVGRRVVAGPRIDDLLPGHRIEVEVVVVGVAPLGPLTVEAVATPTDSAAQPLEGAVPAGRASMRLWAVPYAVIALLLVGAAVARWSWRRGRRGTVEGAAPTGPSRPAVGWDGVPAHR